MHSSQDPTPDTSPLGLLFSELWAIYGAAWVRSHGDAPLADTKAVWRKHLDGFTAGDIKYALAHLPSRCPNVLEFRDLCRAAPKAEPKQLPRPAQDPQKVAEVVGGVKSKLTKLPAVDPKGWALKLKARHERGEKLGSHQVHAYRQALGLDGRQSWQ